MSNALSSPNMADFQNAILSFKKLDKKVVGKNNGFVMLLVVSTFLTLWNIKLHIILSSNTS